MFKALLKVRFLSVFSGLKNSKGKNGNKSSGGTSRLIISIIALVYCVGIFAFLFFGVAGELYPPLSEAGMGWFFYMVMFIAAFLLSFIGSIFMTQSQLYDSKDNQILLTMPIKPSMILLSRLVSLYITNLALSAVVLIPSFVAVILANAEVGTSFASANEPIIFILMCLTIPLLALTMSCIIGYLIALVSSRMRNKTLISIILTIAFTAGYMVLINNMDSYITSIIANAKSFAETIESLKLMYYLGASVGEGNFLYFLIWFGITIAAFVLVYAFLSMSFISITTTKKGAKKHKYVEKELSVSSIKLAFLKKELTHFFKSAAYVMNGLTGNILLIVIIIMVAAKPEYLDKLSFIVSEGTFNGDGPIYVAIMLCFTAAMNIVSASSISTEAKNLWILQTMPINPGDVLEAKALMHIVVCEPITLLASVTVSIILKGNLESVLIAIILPTILNAFCAYFGVYMNLRMPKLNWISETQAIKQSGSVMVSMFINMGIVITLVLAYGLLFMIFVPLKVFICIVGALYLIATLLIRRYFYGKGGEKFLSLQ